MVTCVSGVCGTGTGNFPQPGDPNMNQSLLRATPAFGGIDLNWSWPTVFPEAVAFTRIWRGSSGVFANAFRIVDAAMGSFYYDRIDITKTTSTHYWYWIQMVSVNGTESEIIGPADAVAKPLIEEMIEQLSGKLDRSVLGQALQERIDRIGLNSLGITAEEIERAKNDDGLAVSISEVSAKAAGAVATVQQEMRLRADAVSSLVQTVNTMYADFNGSVAAVQTATTASVKAVDGRVTALASQVSTAQTSTNNNIASVRQTLQTNISTVDGKVTDIGARWTAVVDVNGFVGGFGVYNDGRTVAAGFNVDQFWIGRAGTMRKPFIIDQNVVYIDEAAINRLTFSKLRDEAGAFVVEGGKVQARFIQADQLQVRWANIQEILVQRGHIQDAAVDTLKIAGNSVTVPKFSQQAGSVRGNGGWQDVVNIWFDIPAGGAWLFATATGSMGYDRDQGIAVNTRLMIDGQTVAYLGSRFYYITIAHSGALYFPSARSVLVQLQVNGDAGIAISSCSVFATTMMR